MSPEPSESRAGLQSLCKVGKTLNQFTVRLILLAYLRLSVFGKGRSGSQGLALEITEKSVTEDEMVGWHH